MKEGAERLCEPQIREFAVRSNFLVMSEAIPIKTHQHGCLNVNELNKDNNERHDNIVRSGVGLGGAHEALTLCKELQATEQC